MGWPRNRTRVVDDDQGRSGTSRKGRPGLASLEADVLSEQVRAIAMSEISRLGRNDLELQHFLALCQAKNVLLFDNGVLRDLRDIGDWMVVRLLSLFSEGENLRKNQRCQTARLEIARQGLPVAQLPPGLERLPDKSAVKVADAQVREVLERIWREALAGRSLGDIGRGLVADGLRLPRRAPGGKIRWGEVTLHGLHDILKNPLYAGQVVAYRYRTEWTPTGKRIVKTKREDQEWIPGKIEAYVTLDEFHRVQELLRGRTWKKRPPTGEGKALCPGLLYCGVCGAKLQVHYVKKQTGEGVRRGRHNYYCCGWRRNGNLGKACMSIGGQIVDRLVEAVVLRALVPPSNNTFQQAIQEENTRRQAESRLVAAELRAAEAEVTRKRALFEESRNEGRNPRATQLFADELEVTLLRHDEVERRARRLPPPALLDTAEAFLAELRAAFEAFPTLWRSGQLGLKERKDIIRQIVERIDILDQGDPRRIRITLHSGQVVEHLLHGPAARRALITRLAEDGLTPDQIAAELARRQIPNNVGEPVTPRVVRRMLLERWQAQRADLQTLFERLWQEGVPNTRIAEELNATGFRNSVGNPWTNQTVKLFARRLGLVRRWQAHRDRVHAPVSELLAAGMSNRDIATELNRRGITTYRHSQWTTSGVSRVRKVLGVYRQPPLRSAS